MEPITAGQLRAARGLLGLSQRELAAVSKVSRATIADFEAGKRQPYPRTLADLQRSLEVAGVVFTSNDDLLGVKIKRAKLPAAAAASDPPARPSIRVKPEAPSAERRRRVLERVANISVTQEHPVAADASVTPEQIRAARELLGWSQLDLANTVGVSETAVSLFEREKRRLLMVDPEQMRAALESAGVEFTEAGEAGVRLKPSEPEIPLEEFSSQLERYEQQHLRPKGVNLGPKGGVKFGFALLYLDRNSAGLMLEGKELGRVQWREGTVEFDPPIAPSDRARGFEDKLALWASGAYARSLAGVEQKPIPNLRQYVLRSDNPREAQSLAAPRG